LDLHQPRLKRLIARSGWRVIDYATAGNTSASDPITRGRRKSVLSGREDKEPLTDGRLVSGWHRAEGFENWRWTERKFSVAFTDIAAGAPHVLTLEFFLPAVIEENLGALELRGSVNGHPLAPKSSP